jgi:hypothetical protein
MRFPSDVKQESSDTLYEAANREKLKQETTWQIRKSEQGTRKISSRVMAMLFGITLVTKMLARLQSVQLVASGRRKTLTMRAQQT